MISLKLLGRQLKRAETALRIKNALRKKLATDPKTKQSDLETVDAAIKQITEYRDRVRNVIRTRQDPNKAIRCSLPKKQQRKLGLLPSIEIITK